MSTEDVIAAYPAKLMVDGTVLDAKVAGDLAALLIELIYYTDHNYLLQDGEDEITQLLQEKYQFSADLCREFIRLLKELISAHGESVVAAGQALAVADDVATDQAWGKRA
jgi:hypothetical protein